MNIFGIIPMETDPDRSNMFKGYFADAKQKALARRNALALDPSRFRRLCVATNTWSTCNSSMRPITLILDL